MTIIRANILPPLRDPGLVAAWLPRPVNGVIPDVSGNGKTGTLVQPGSCYEEDPYFGPCLRNYANEAGFTFPCTLGLTTQGTWGLWYLLSTPVLPAGNYSLLLNGSAFSDYAVALQGNNNCRAAAGLVLNGANRALLDPAAVPSIVGVPTLQITTYDGDKMRIHRDASLVATSPSYAGPISAWNAGVGRVGYSSAATYAVNGRVFTPFVINRAWTQDEITAYYNLAKRACWMSEYRAVLSLANEGGVVGQYISNTPWQCSDTTGRFRIQTDTINGRTVKCITCITAGTIYMDMAQARQAGGMAAFGEWEWWHKRVEVANHSLGFIASATATATTTGYEIVTTSTGGLICYRRAAGAVAATEFSTANGAYALNAWNKYNMRRTVAAVGTVLLNDVVVPVAAGANPFTDANVLTGQYVFVDMGVGDKISLGAIDGSAAFVKRVKG